MQTTFRAVSCLSRRTSPNFSKCASNHKPLAQTRGAAFLIRAHQHLELVTVTTYPSAPTANSNCRATISNITHFLSPQHSRAFMAAGGDQDQPAEPVWRERLGQTEAKEFDNSLFFEYEFSIDQLMELAGLCVAQAVARCYSVQGSGGQPAQVLIVCGPGNNGGDGLAAARHLLFFGYAPVLYYPKKTSKDIYQILVAQCEKLNIRFLDNLPTSAEIDSQYSVVVDAIFGFSFKGSVRAPFDKILTTMREIKTPIASVDIPSGWDVEKGDVHGVGLNPDLLVSLTAPKECAKFFSGRHHYLGLRIIPKELSDKYRIKLPQYPGTDQIVKLQ